ncbi:ROK family transcriptional regulator [Streptomyces violens]|uniref:ROK family transcriptional regulator n=1 Tax=Streptomyces violens TaxID=66377 RepID=UPI00055C5B8E|nr:ROK family transcriptional regulator [Streptomyces violens]
MDATSAPSTPLAGAGRAVALEVLLRGPVTRSEIARRLSMSAGSLTRLANPLVDSGLLVEVDADHGQAGHEARTGRRSRPLDINAAAHHFIGAKVTGDDVHAVLTTLRAEVVGSARKPLPGRDPASVVATIAELIGELTAEGPRISRVGVSLGGRVAHHTTVTAAPFLEWSEDVPLGSLLADALGLPVTVDNDLLALTRAEHWFGTARGHDRFAVLTIGAGVGYGLVMHDTVVDSPDVGVGLLGHCPLDPMGPLCPNGHRGCATAMLSRPSICAAVSVGLRRSVTYDECLDLAAHGDPVAAPVITAAGRALGRLLAAVANFTLVQKIVLTGEGVRLAEVARTAVEEAVRADRDPSTAPLELDVQHSDFAYWARGAAATAIQAHVLEETPAVG